MTPQAFLRAVLPPPGHGKYCVAELSSKKKKHAFVDTVEDAAEQANLFGAQKLNTFFAYCTFENSESREAQNARWVRAFCIDIGSHVSARAGVTDEQLLALPRHREAPCFSELERLVIEVARSHF